MCLTIVLVTAIPAFQELARASRSAERLFDTLYRELPPTLEAIRLTGLEISDLTDDISEGVESAGSVVKQVDQGLRSAQRQMQDVGTTTYSVFVGVKAAWKSLMRPSPKRRRRSSRDLNERTATDYRTGHSKPAVRPSDSSGSTSASKIAPSMPIEPYEAANSDTFETFSDD
ncbi:MAG TPA: DUF948 domain-containing protein [Stenomitos sp.]